MVKKARSEYLIFDMINSIILFIVAIVTILPFVHIFASSFATVKELLMRKVLIFPTQFSLEAYEYIFSTPTITRSLLSTIYLTVTGTIVNLFFTVLTAYPLAHRNLPGRAPIMKMITFTLMFGGGMIPTFLLVKGLGLINSYWALILPGAINTFNLIVVKNFFQQIPVELEESAKIDGCNDLFILLRIVLPLSRPVLATFALFYSVGHWNSFFDAILYLSDSKKWPIQVLLRQIVILSEVGVGDPEYSEIRYIPPQTVSKAVIVVATVPILMVYPFLQKHFAKGMMLGSIKG